MLTIDIKARTFPGIPFQHIGDLVPRRTPGVPRRAQKYLYKCFHPIWVQDSKSIWGKNGEELKKNNVPNRTLNKRSHTGQEAPFSHGRTVQYCILEGAKEISEAGGKK